MRERLFFPKVAPGTHAAIRAQDGEARGGGVEPPPAERVKLRASRIDGCAFCPDMPAKDARKPGETEQRLCLPYAWRETPSYRERAALAWSECLTRLPIDGAAWDVCWDLEAAFTPVEIANLTAPIGVIDVWNGVAVGLNRALPGAAWAKSPGAA